MMARACTRHSAVLHDPLPTIRRSLRARACGSSSILTPTQRLRARGGAPPLRHVLFVCLISQEGQSPSGKQNGFFQSGLTRHCAGDWRSWSILVLLDSDSDASHNFLRSFVATLTALGAKETLNSGNSRMMTIGRAGGPPLVESHVRSLHITLKLQGFLPPPSEVDSE